MTAATTGRQLNRAAGATTIGKILSGVAQIADIGANRGSAQVQGFGYLLFRAPFPPEPNEKLVAFGFGRGFSGQEFRRRERTDMPIRNPGENLLEADSQCADEPDHGEDPEVPTAAPEVDEIAPAHGGPVRPAPAEQDRPAVELASHLIRGDQSPCGIQALTPPHETNPTPDLSETPGTRASVDMCEVKLERTLT